MRLTRQNELARFGYEYIAPHRLEHFGEGIAKLGQLEDIEEELGIGLVTLFTILRTGGCIWVKNCKGINQWHVESLKQRGLDKQWYLTYSNNVRVKLKDYGKTWAVTREELD